MQDRTLYALLLGIEAPWAVTDVMLRLAEEHAVVVRVAMELIVICGERQYKSERPIAGTMSPEPERKRR